MARAKPPVLPTAALPPVLVQGRNRRHAIRVFAVANEVDLQAVIGGVHRMLQAAGVHAAEAARIVTAASELGHNVLRYAGHGQLTVRVGEIGDKTVCELVAQDHGPGIADIERALGDHFTTGGGLGLGLPGVRRLMDVFAIDSALGEGTCVTVRRWL